MEAAVAAGDLDLIVDALSNHCDHGSPGPVAAARAKRNQLKQRAKKAQRQQRRVEEAEAVAPELIRAIASVEDVASLEAALAEAQRLEGLVAELDTEAAVGWERLRQLKQEQQAARKAATLEALYNVVLYASATTCMFDPHLAGASGPLRGRAACACGAGRS